MRIYTKAGAPVVAVQDGVVVGIGETERLGKFVRLRDAYGNRYVYGHLARSPPKHPVPRERRASAKAIRHELGLDRKDKKPKKAATAGRRGERRPRAAPSAAEDRAVRHRPSRAPRPPARDVAGVDRRAASFPAGVTSYDAWFAQPYTLDPRGRGARAAAQGLARHRRHDPRPRRPRLAAPRGRRSNAADRSAERTVAGAEGVERAPHLWFEVRPAGSGTPRVDPKPILDGWRLLSATKIYRAAAQSWPPTASRPS